MNKLGKILLIILIAFLSLNLLNVFFHFFTGTLLETDDKFEIFRDLLIILLTILAVTGYFLYKEVGRKILEEQKEHIIESEKNLKQIIKDCENEIFTKVYDQLAYAHYQEYQRMDSVDPLYEELCTLAIDEAERAIGFYEKFNQKEEGKLCIYKVSLAYHLASRRYPEDKVRALELVQDNWENAIKYKPSEEYNIRESLIWVILRCSDENEEKKKAEKDLSDLMKWSTLPQDWKKFHIDKYRKYFRISLDV